MRLHQWTDGKLAELSIYRAAKRPASWIAKEMSLTPRQVEHGIHLLEHPTNSPKENDR